MTRASKKPNRFSPVNLVLMSVVVVASLTYIAYYSSLSVRTHSDATKEKQSDRKVASASNEYLNDEDYVAYVLKMEEESQAERRHKRQSFQQPSSPQFISEPIYDRYVEELQTSLDQIPLDQPGLRNPIEERLRNSRDE